MTNAELRRHSEKLVQQGNIAEAGKVLSDALALQPFDPNLNIAKANVMLASKQFRGAIDVLKAVTSRRPEQADAWFLLGNAYRGTRVFSEARNAYQRVIALAPDFPGASHYLGVCCQALGDLDAATEHYEHAVALRPDMTILYHRLGSAHHMAGRFGDAIAAYQQVLRREEGNLQTRTNLTLALLGARRFGDALSAAKSHLRMAPTQTIALSNLAYSALGAQDHAIANRLLDFEHMLQTGPAGLDPAQRQSLAEYVRAEAPDARPGMVGTRLTAQLDNNHPALSSLVEVLGERVDAVIAAATARDITLPSPTNWTIRAWGEVRHGTGLDSRGHPAASLGALYHVEGEASGEDGGEEFGRGDDAYLRLEPASMPIVRFDPDQLTVFPAWFYHRALPAPPDTTLISVIFDIAAG